MFGLLETEEVNLGRRGGRSYIYSIVDEPRVVIETLYNMDRFENSSVTAPRSSRHV